MLIGPRLREAREANGLSQAKISQLTGLVQPYVSRVESGHTIPGVETLEKWAQALNIPLYQLMYDGEEPPQPLKLARKDAGNVMGRRSAGSAGAPAVAGISGEDG